MNKWVLSILILFLFSGILMAQGEIRSNPAIFYRNEKTGGFLLNSNGWGGSYRFAKRVTARDKTIWEVDLVNIKHPKEVKISNSYYNNRSFVYGKENSFFNLRGSWGKQKEMFKKIDRGGISIRRYFSVGPAIGFLKPIYYEVFKSGGLGNDYYITEEKFDPSTHQSNIYGKASFFMGFDEISIVPGVFGRAGISFEYSQSDITIHALETGISLDLFPKEMRIMATEKNNFYFLTLFVSYRFGKVVDATGMIDEEDLMY